MNASITKPGMYRSKRAVREAAAGLAVVVPIFIYTLLFTVAPLIMLVRYSMTDYGVSATPQFTGLENFITIFRTEKYYSNFLSTFVIAVFVTGLGLVLGFLLGVLLNSMGKGKGFTRTLWYIPGLISMAIISQFINFMIAPAGALNRLLESMGSDPVLWTRSVFWMYFFIIGTVVWRGLGGTAILFIAGLNSIDPVIYEAARIDGAGRVRTLFAITLPLIRPMLGFILITGFINAMGIFEPVMLISRGGPDSATKVILYAIYDDAFANSKFGLSCALSLIVTAVTMLLSLVNIAISDKSIFKEEAAA